MLSAASPPSEQLWKGIHLFGHLLDCVLQMFNVHLVCRMRIAEPALLRSVFEIRIIRSESPPGQLLI